MWGGLQGSGGFALAAAYSCEVVLPPALVADGAISRAVMSSYSGRGTLAMAWLVAVGAWLIIVSIVAVFDVIPFSVPVLATCSIYALLRVLVIDRNLSISPRCSFNRDEHSRYRMTRTRNRNNVVPMARTRPLSGKSYLVSRSLSYYSIAFCSNYFFSIQVCIEKASS